MAVRHDRRQGRYRITLEADKAGACSWASRRPDPRDVEDCVGDLRTRNVTSHVAINRAVSKTGKVRKPAIDGRPTRHSGDALSQRGRTRIEKVFGWVRAQAGRDKVKVRSWPKLDAVFTFVRKPLRSDVTASHYACTIQAVSRIDHGETSLTGCTQPAPSGRNRYDTSRVW